MLTTLSLIAVVVLALGLGFTLQADRRTPRTQVPAIVVESRFVPDKAADGRTRVTIRTEDGQTYIAMQPGRRTWAVGASIRAEVVRGRVIRLFDAA